MSAKHISKLAAISSVSMAISIAATSLLIASPSVASSRRSQSRYQAQVSQTRFANPQSTQTQAPQKQVAQLFRSTLSLPAGQTIATKINRQDTLYIAKGETVAPRYRGKQWHSVDSCWGCNRGTICTCGRWL